MSSSASYLDPVVLPLIVGDSVLDVVFLARVWELNEANIAFASQMAAQDAATCC